MGKAELIGQGGAELTRCFWAVACDDRAVYGDRLTGPPGAMRAQIGLLRWEGRCAYPVKQTGVGKD
jgi:hypothetical protein